MEILYSIIKVLEINETLFIYLATFTVIFFLVSNFLMKPYFEKYIQRQEKTKGLIEKAEKMRKENATMLNQYEVQFVAFNEKFSSHLQKKRKEILQNHKKLIEAAHSQARVLIENSKKEFNEQYLKAKKELNSQAPEWAKTLSLKILK